MTENYAELSKALPVFGELRNCFDLAVVAALLTHEGLLVKAGCELGILMDSDKLQCPELPTASTVPSLASHTQTRRGLIVSVSGGVEIDPWSLLDNAQETASIAPITKRAAEKHDQRWWW